MALFIYCDPCGGTAVVICIHQYIFKRTLRFSVNALSNITRDSHYVPQAMFRRWSVDGNRVYAYRTLVSRAEVRLWELRSIKGLACQPDLYTTLSGEQEVDNFEKWIAKEYEDPGFEAISKLLTRVPLVPSDWHHLARLVAAQDVRTPLDFIESLRRWEKQMPAVLERAVQKSIENLRHSKAEGIALASRSEKNAFSEAFRAYSDLQIEPGADQTIVRATVSAHRGLWLFLMRHLLKTGSKELCRHQWGVAEPYGEEEWPLTDHPVLRLNYYRPGEYDFGGGWGNDGSEIMMPVSPRHLLYVQVGKKTQARFVFSQQNTLLVQRLLAERAHRWIFMKQPTDWVSKFRPRIVDQKVFDAERKAWKQWHRQQLSLEARPPLP